MEPLTSSDRGMFTEPLPNNNREYTQRHRLIGGIYVVRHWDGLTCHDTHTMFHKDWFGHSEINRSGYADTQTSWRSHKPILIFQYNTG